LGPDLWKVNNIVSSIYFIINITCASIFIHSRFMPPNTEATAVVNPDDDVCYYKHRQPLDHSRQGDLLT
jgi:hypothetical protein